MNMNRQNDINNTLLKHRLNMALLDRTANERAFFEQLTGMEGQEWKHWMTPLHLKKHLPTSVFPVLPPKPKDAFMVFLKDT